MDRVISPTHKRTEGHAPVWGSKFTSKAAAIQGGSEETAPTPNVRLWISVRDWLVVIASYLFLEQPSPRKFDIFLKDSSPSCWFMLVYFAPGRSLPRPRRPSSQFKLDLSPKQRAKPKTSARKTGRSMLHCVARWVWLLRVLRSGG
jgi:hypothetical protein